VSIHDVRYFDSQMTGAPVKDGINAAGKLLQIFDACLVNGFNLQAVNQIVVAGGVATATTQASDHGFRDYTVLRIAGCTETGLNGDWKSNVSAGNTFSWPTTVADGTYGGTISAKTAPLGWSKPFSDTNIGVYRPGAGLRHYFRVNDTAVTFVNIRGYEMMPGAADVGTQPFPTVLQLSNGTVIFKTADSNNTKQRWAIFGDARVCYLIFSAADNDGILSGQGSDYTIQGFGEGISYVPGDVGFSFISAAQSSAAPLNSQNGLNYPGLTAGDDHRYGGFYVSRPWSQLTGSPTRLRCAGSGLVDGWGSVSEPKYRTPTPNPADGALLFHHPILVQEESTAAVRGEMPGLWQPLNTRSIANVGSVFDVDGRKIMVVRGPDSATRNINSTDRMGAIGVDITGPWR
jgi:hypothetical protein